MKLGKMYEFIVWHTDEPINEIGLIFGLIFTFRVLKAILL